MESGEKILLGMIVGLTMIGTIAAAIVNKDDIKPTKSESSLSRWFDGK